MKTAKMITSFLFAAALFLIASIAQATTFTVTSNFSDLVGNNEDFKWSLATTPTHSFDLLPGQSRLFTFGRFYTDDFGLDQRDLNDNNDSFLASLSITPPNAAVTRIGEPDATKFLWLVDLVKVDFANDPITITYGNGGKYTVTFLDAYLLCDGWVDLTAVLCNKSDPAPAPVPEPGTMMLLGTGLLAVVLYGKRRTNA